MIIRKCIRFCASTAPILILLLGCAAERRAPKTDKQLFDEIKIGMSRVEVESVLGKPVLEVGNEVNYGKAPKIKEWQSPVSPTSISIFYSAQKVVESKRYYGRD